MASDETRAEWLRLAVNHKKDGNGFFNNKEYKVHYVLIIVTVFCGKMAVYLRVYVVPSWGLYFLNTLRL